jgi:hypothetical protein
MQFSRNRCLCKEERSNFRGIGASLTAIEEAKRLKVAALRKKGATTPKIGACL